MIQFIRKFNNKTIALVIFVFLGLTAGFLLWKVTQLWGIGVGYDSYYYVSSANNYTNGLGFGVLAGDGSINPLVKYPPFYPIILIVASWVTGLETLIAARWVAIGLYALSVFLIGWIIYVYSNSMVTGAFGSMLLLSNCFWLSHFYKAMSEPPYIVLMLLMLYALTEYGKTKEVKLLFLSAIFSGLGFLTRYIGGSLVFFCGLSILILSNNNRKEKLKSVLQFSLAVGLVISPWWIKNTLLTGAPTDRGFLFHPPAWDKFTGEFPNIYDWLLPFITSNTYKAYIFTGFLLGLVIVTFLLYRNQRSRNIDQSEDGASLRFIFLVWGYIFIYLFLLYFSMTFFDASTRFSGRILSPIYPLFVILSTLIVRKGAAIFNCRLVDVAAIILGMLIVGFNIQAGEKLVPMDRLNGWGFTGREWRNSETIAVIAELDPQTLIYTNENFPLAFLTGRYSNDVPEKISQVRNKDNTEHYFNAIDEMHQQIKQEQGILVLFFTIRKNENSHTIKELSQGLILWKKTEDGKIFYHPDAMPDFVEGFWEEP